VISAAFALVQGPMSFYVLRFLLGLADAGFTPGMIFSLGFKATVRAVGNLHDRWCRAGTGDGTLQAARLGQLTS
jgi:hypothetical protein